jgi:hypothetical protein
LSSNENGPEDHRGRLKNIVVIVSDSRIYQLNVIVDRRFERVDGHLLLHIGRLNVLSLPFRLRCFPDGFGFLSCLVFGVLDCLRFLLFLQVWARLAIIAVPG